MCTPWRPCIQSVWSKSLLSFLWIARNPSFLQTYSQDWFASRKHAYIMLTSLNPNFYVAKFGFTGVYIIFNIAAQKHCGYSLELSCWGGSNEYPKSIFWAEIWTLSEFLSENFHFLLVKFLNYLNRLVFIMDCIHTQFDLSICWAHMVMTEDPFYHYGVNY